MINSGHFKHLKTGGNYLIITEGTHVKTKQEYVVYQSQETGKVWIRDKEEFYDGRFEEIES